MDFSFSFMQGIMGNTIQQPPQLIDSANIRQEDTYDASSNLGENGGRSTYDSALESGFCYPPSAPEDLPGVTNGYLPTMGLYESQTKYGMYSQFPNGSANGYSAIRNYGDHYLVPGEGIVLRAPVVHEKPPPSSSPVSHPHHHHQQQNHLQSTNSPLPLHTQHHPLPPHLMPHVVPPPVVLPNSPPAPSPLNRTPPHPLALVPLPSNLSKKTGSPEIKLKIIKTYHNGRELFESALCGDLLHEVQAGETSRRRHEHKKEKRKKNSGHHSQNTEPELQKLEQPQGVSSVHLEETVLRGPQPCERREELDTPRNCKGPNEEAKDPKQYFSTVPVSTGDFKDHEVGDLVWAKVGTYPWWPCMVSRDPQSKVHTRINTRGHQEYHVQFFGSVPERAWIHEKRVVVYQGQHQFDELQAETLRKTSNPVERHKLLKPIPQRERVQWEVGVGHAEDAFLMTREERIENYTFIYVDEVPSTSPPRAAKVGKKARRSRGSGREDNSGSPEGEQRSTRQQPRRQSSQSTKGPEEDEDEEEEEVEDEQNRQFPVPNEPTEAQQQSPPVKTAWKTAAARKLLPLSVTMKKLNVEMIKCEWPSSREQALSPRRMEVEGWQDCGSKPELSSREQQRLFGPLGRRSESSLMQHTLIEAPAGPLERKQQRRSVRSRSESEKGAEPVPKKKLKKEQSEMVPQTALKTGSQKGASEISDSCKPLKKRSRASTDMETASSQYRDTSDSDSRGLSDPQVLFGKGLDSPMAADASDTQSVDSSLSRQGGVASKKDTVCQICEGYGDALVSCEGECCRLFHLECLGLMSRPEGRFTCLECTNGSHNCFSCKDPGGDMMQCLVSGCGRFYHEACARKHPGTSIEPRGLSCPQHCCATCCLERDMQKASKGRMMRCMRCPIAYHTGDGCIAAGSVMITPHVIVCSNHSSSKRNGHLTSPVNVGWCFVCARGLLVQDHTDNILSSYAYKSHYLLTESNRAELMKLPMIPSSSSATKKNIGKGGRLLCCESCPASFHPECLSIEMPEGAWCCSECRAGKRPHYKQIVWVKLGSYRWWPAEICNPRLVPFNIQTLKHDIGEFPVFFFGSHDYYWIGRGRVFPYVESDKNFAEGQMGISKTFKKALEEAAKRFQELKAQRESREALEQERNSRRPPPYKFIKSNKPVGKVQVHIADLSEIPRCNCRPTDENPCGLDSQCLNRMLQYECHPQVCPAGERCHNQSFSRRLYPETEVIKTEGRGWGLRTKQHLKKGDFVLEYVGELIDSEECRLRIKRAHENHVTNFYMLTLTKDRVIDAGPKGNFSRFMNHSCSPNCETQKWTVNGDVRIGLFALCDIMTETELTFNYNLDCLGNGRTSCHCGAENCSGFLGVRPKSAVVMEKEEKARNAKLKPKKRKLKPESKQIHEYFCFRCGEGGELVMCDKKDCPKAYHLLCLNLSKPPFGRWECPWHQCSVCLRAASSFCHFCPNSFCKDHEQGMLVPSALDGRPCCSAHDPQSPLEPRSADLSRVKVKEEPPELGE
ncbi:histone-lysine N-methyltransferase NSD3-like isoform X1 [Brienomyrus brachyistius]|uniref:histone-lysine N-methyltransferase NSD3-like isoform X1 n=1 Tax=Brienomyrus brachyistius TaxID=42636 RepID=UPI0020B2949C|nr:histone-lysine N-methyltransferase NSD3-like isoform X1 [Brienomyrus brachyistius]